MKMHLAIDMGSESGRAVVGYLQDGRLVTRELRRFRTQFMQLREKSYRDLYRIHEEIMAALADYAREYGPVLDSVSVCSWGGDFVVLNRDGNFNHMPISYRAVHAIDRTQGLIEKAFGERRLYERNGNQRMPQDPLRALLRMKLEDDPSLDDPHGMLFVADAMHYMLGADAVCERSMPTFGRLYDFRRDAWDKEVFAAFGLPEGLCTRIAGPGEVIGYIDEAILTQAGLQGPVPIVTSCTHDTAAALTAVPDNGSDWGFISCGTWALMGTETDAPVINDIAFENNFNNSSVPFGANMFKRNMTGTWIISECHRAWKTNSYDEIVRAAEAAPDNDLSIDINGSDFYDAKDMPGAIVAALKRDFGADIAPDDIGTIAAVVFRSMALKYRLYLEQLLSAAGKQIRCIYMLGGGSRNRLLVRYTADACGYPVRTGVYEGSAVGNLLLQAYACGELADKAAIREVSAATFPQAECVPDPDAGAGWQRKLELYRSSVLRTNLW